MPPILICKRIKVAQVGLSLEINLLLKNLSRLSSLLFVQFYSANIDT